MQAWHAAAYADRQQRDGVGQANQARRGHAVVRRQASPNPLDAKALGVFVVAYALSPIDLIPDFVPVLGYVDDVLLLPGLIWLTIRLLPADVLVECRGQADEWMASKGSKPTSKVGAALIVLLWLLACWAGWRWSTTWSNG